MENLEHEESVTEVGNYRIVDRRGYRSLRTAGNDRVNYSCMCLERPDSLDDRPYAQALMRFALFHPDARDILVIGLGGGDVVRFARRRLPRVRMVAVELEPLVVEIARTYFCLPPDDERLSVVVGEGCDYAEGHPGSFDIILADAYNQEQEYSEEMRTERFYRACHRALREDGILALNLFGVGDWIIQHTDMALKIFDSVLTTKIGDQQRVDFAFKRPPTADLRELAERARSLEPQCGLRLPEFVEGLTKAGYSLAPSSR
jgi:spermidine synthase